MNPRGDLGDVSGGLFSAATGKACATDGRQMDRSLEVAGL